MKAPGARATRPCITGSLAARAHPPVIPLRGSHRHSASLLDRRRRRSRRRSSVSRIRRASRSAARLMADSVSASRTSTRTLPQDRIFASSVHCLSMPPRGPFSSATQARTSVKFDAKRPSAKASLFSIQSLICRSPGTFRVCMTRFIPNLQKQCRDDERHHPLFIIVLRWNRRPV